MTTVDHEPHPTSGRHAADEAPPAGPGPGERRLLWIGVITVAAVLGIAVFIVMARGLVHDLRQDTHPGASHDRHRVTGPAHGRHEATLDLASGVTTVTVRSRDLGGDLYRISTPGNGSLLPAVVDRGDRVEVQLTASGHQGASSVLVELSAAVAWHIRLGGGSSEALLDLRQGGLASLDFVSGISTIEVSLPKPHGTVRVGLAGGASSWTVHLPAGVPAQLRVGGGAGSATVDGTSHSGVSGGEAFRTGGYDGASDRYDLEATSGVSTIVVDRR